MYRWGGVRRSGPGAASVSARAEAAGRAFRGNARLAFARRNVDPTRLDLVGVRGKHLPYYNTMDIALDSLPQVDPTPGSARTRQLARQDTPPDPRRWAGLHVLKDACRWEGWLGLRTVKRGTAN